MSESKQGLHVAIIMDGNGRWAAARGWPRVAGHRAGASSVRKVLEAAPDLGIGHLTLYAFSADNWKRPAREISLLFGLLQNYLAEETQECIEKGVRISFVGRRDRLPQQLVAAMEETEALTAEGKRVHLRVALDYSSRQAIEKRDFAPDVDLLIRTSGEQRLSDFLLWECAYAELLFTPVHWPDFGAQELAAAVQDFHSRQRRFGGLVTVQAG